MLALGEIIAVLIDYRWLIAAISLLALLLELRAADEILPSDDHEHGQPDREDHILLVVDHTDRLAG